MFSSFIHIFHIKSGEFGGLLGIKKRTNVLCRYHKNGFLSKKREKQVDI